MKKFLFFSVFLIIFPNPFSAQQNNIDSINSVIEKILVEQFPKLQPNEQTKKLELLEKAEKLNNGKENKYLVFIENNKGILCEEQGNIAKAFSYYKKAEQISENTKDYLSKAKALQMMGISNGKRDRKDSADYYFNQAVNFINSKISFIDEKKAQQTLAHLYSNLASSAVLQKKFDKAVDYGLKGMDLAKNTQNTKAEINSCSIVGLSFMHLKNYSKAKEYFNKEYILYKETKDPNIGINRLHFASLYTELKDYSLAEKYAKEGLDILKESKNAYNINTAKQNLFSIYKLENKYKQAHLLEDDLLAETKSLGRSLTNLYIDIAELYTKEKNYSAAEKYFTLAEQEMSERKEQNTKFFKKKAEYFEAIGQVNEALKMKDKEMKIAESRNTESFIKAITNYETKYKVKEKEKLIKIKELQVKNKQLEIEKEKSNRNMAIGVTCFLILFSTGGFLWNHNRQKRKDMEQKNNVLELQYNLQAMELSNLNKQLDPHEFKNLLLSLAPEIQQKSPETYRKMAKLASLLKSSLSNSSLTENLETQLEQIEIYLNLEKSTLSFPLEYIIDKQITTSNIQIPRLLLKNLVENALKHGIKPKQQSGIIYISISEKENFIFIKIDDNGVGRNTTNENTGIGISTYTNLFKLLNEKNSNKAQFEVNDNIEGTSVFVSIPINYNYQLNNQSSKS